jgi:hypothetical protein
MESEQEAASPGPPAYDFNTSLIAALEQERLAYADYMQVQTQSQSFDFKAAHPWAEDEARGRWEAAKALVEQLRSRL